MRFVLVTVVSKIDLKHNIVTTHIKQERKNGKLDDVQRRASLPSHQIHVHFLILHSRPRLYSYKRP